MPNYTYACAHHGEFTLNQSMNENHDYAVCPDCNQNAKRVFVPFNTSKMDSKLKRRIESGQEPKVVSHNKLPNKSKQQSTHNRPWMV